MSAVVIDPRTLEGTPVFRGTSVPVQALFEQIESGRTLEEFLLGHPTVSRELAIEALEEARVSLIRAVELTTSEPRVVGGPLESPELEWLRLNRDKYRGKWVALNGFDLIAHGNDGKLVFRQAQEAGVKSPFLSFIEKDPLPFAGWKCLRSSLTISNSNSAVPMRESSCR
jgi:uncharacterized protein (DUF433 family)